MTANNVIMDLNASAANAEASALYVGLTNSGNPTNVTVNFPEITSRSSDVTGLAFVANSVGTVGNVSVIEINGGVLNAEASTAEIRRMGSVFNLTIDNVARCTINGTAISCP